MEIHSSKILWRWYDVFDLVFLKEPGTKNERGKRDSVFRLNGDTKSITGIIKYFIRLITEAQISLVLTGEAGRHTGLCGSRRGDWCQGHSQMCLKSSCRSLEQMVRTCTSGGSSEFRYKEEARGKGNSSWPRGHLQMWSLQRVWFVV